MSEDSARCTQLVASSLARRIVRVIDPAVRTDRILFVPLDREDPAATCVSGNNWRSSKDPNYRESRRLLMKTLATHLAIPGGFVFFHVDGDVPWSQRAQVKNVEDFDKHVVQELRRFLQGKLDALETTAALSKLFLLMPFYSIEAWLYQNTAEAMRLCDRLYEGRDRQAFQRWARARASLDDVMKPKEAVCLRDRHNSTLASNAFPAEVVYGVGPSFTAAVDSLKNSSEFTRALAETH